MTRTEAGLSREMLVETARDIVRREGTKVLTMRRLAAELNVSPMAAYHHVRNKEELLELVSMAVLDDANQASALTDDVPWERALIASAHITFNTLAQHPGLGAFLQDRPLSARLREDRAQRVKRLMGAGLSEHDAEMAYATYVTFMFGLLRMEDRFRPMRRKASGEDRAILVDAPVDEFVDYAVGLIVEGMRARIRARNERPVNRRGR